MNARRLVRVVLTAGLASAMLVELAVAAQRVATPPRTTSPGVPVRGGRGPIEVSSRLDWLVAAFTLDNEQKKQTKKIMDDAYKAAKPLRDRLKASRKAAADAILKGLPEPDIDAAIAAYGRDAAAMASAEMAAFVQFASVIYMEAQSTPEKVRAATFLMRGAFNGDKWDTTPDVKMY